MLRRRRTRCGSRISSLRSPVGYDRRVVSGDRLAVGRSSEELVTAVGERVGIFGGTFDPPHIGHLVVAVNVRWELKLDRVLLVVANVPWQKVNVRPITPSLDRLAMVEAAVADVDGLEASALEIERGGISYTGDTLANLQEDDPTRELFLILGSDTAAGLPTWERVGEVRRRATIVIVGRPGAMEGQPPGQEWGRVEAPRLEVSSTDLRARVADGRPLDYLLPQTVIDVIEERGLYR